MKPHRVSLTDDELGLVAAALRARAAALRHGPSYAKVIRLALRLEEMAPGNPNYRLRHELAAELAKP